ncbi:MAG: alpha/beta hydrolase [Prevotellaceae bacterium]|nr:alpha/beta hydrolase [Prevotellaceae bacterium]
MTDNQSTEYITMPDGEKIALHSWLPDGEIRWVVQVCHGMIEYAERYNHVGVFLCRHGIAMYAHDQRGHGDTACTPERLGFIADRNGFQTVIEDLREIINRVKQKHSGCKIVLLAHSFGSFVTQGYIEQYGSEIDACILSGTAGPRPFSVWAAKSIACIIKTVKGAHFRSQFMSNLVFGNYNRRIQHPKSKNAWLTRDESIVEKYDSDMYTTFIPTIGFFYDLFSGLSRIHKKKQIDAIPKNLPIHIVVGQDDPVGGYGKLVEKLYRLYRSAGIRRVSLKIYPGGRHELLNEINRQQVMDDLLYWMEKLFKNCLKAYTQKEQI